MMGLNISCYIRTAVAIVAACPFAAALATIAPGPHAITETWDPPQAETISIETIAFARLLASARNTDFTYSGSGRKIRVRYEAPAIRTSLRVVTPESLSQPKRPTATLSVSRLPSLNPRRMQTVVMPSPAVRVGSIAHSMLSPTWPLRQLTALPELKNVFVGPQWARHPKAFEFAKAIKTTSRPEFALQQLGGRHPHTIHSSEIRVASLGPSVSGVEAVPDIHPQEVESIEAALSPDTTTAAPYIPWAVRQEQASGVRTGPVHGNPHLAPHVTRFTSTHKPGTVVVHVKEKRLYLIQSPTTARVYPIGTARGTADILGATRVTTRRFMPTWTPTPNQRRRDPTLPRRVEAGPNNPLGVRALGLGWRYRLIHGTSDPSSIGFAQSDGCIRMLNDDVSDLFNRVKVGNRVLVLASAKSDLIEWRPAGYKEYKPRRRVNRRKWRKKRWRSSRRYASKRVRRKKRR